MKKKKFATNINLSELAKELGISSMTLYRVMNNEPAVRPSTKKRVIEALNKKGYNAYQGQTGGKVVFDFSHNNYLLYFGAQLMQRLSDNRFSIVLTNHRERRIAFLDAAAEAEVVVFCSEPDESIVAEMRKQNPQIYSISLFGYARNVDVILRSNDALGGAQAAHHLHALGHRKHVAVHHHWNHSDAERRIFYFAAEMKRLDPDCRIDVLRSFPEQELCQTCQEYFIRNREPPSAIFFVMDSGAQEFCNAVRPFLPDEMKRIGILSYGVYEKISAKDMVSANIDRIDFSAEDILRWITYLVTNRPMLGCDGSMEMMAETKLYVAGSVPDLLRNPEKSERGGK